MFKFNVQMFQIFKCSNYQILKCSNVQMLKCSKSKTFKCSNFQMFRCSNVKCQMSNFHKVELFLESTSGVPPVIFIQVIDLLYNAYTNRDFEYLKSKSLDVCNASSFETKQQKGFHEEHFSCS